MKKTIFFLLATLFSSTLSAYFLTQKVPLYFDFQYWDSSKSFESFSDIKDNYLCLERGDKCYCDIANSNPVCTIYDFDNNISIDIKDDLKKEKYNNLTIVDINDTFPDLDSFDGYNQNQQAVTSISNHPVNTEQDYFIVFGSSHVRKATDKETVYTKEFLHGLNDPSTLTKGSTEVTNDFNNKDYQNELGNYYDHNNTNNPNKQTDTQTATSNLYTHAGADSKKMEDIQDIIGESATGYFLETDGPKTFINSGAGGVNFGDINTSSFLSDYTIPGVDTNRILGQLGLSGSAKCYFKPGKWTGKTRFNIAGTKICTDDINGYPKLNDFSNKFEGGFGTDTIGTPRCELNGEFKYNANTDMCSGCEDENDFWDKENNVCKSCGNDATYDKVLNICVANEFVSDFVAESEKVEDKMAYFWAARCSKKSHTATIIYTGTEESLPASKPKCVANGVVTDLGYNFQTNSHDYRTSIKIEKCQSDYQSKCAWKPLDIEIYKEYTMYDISSWGNFKMIEPPKNEPNILDYRVNNYTHGSLWAGNERQKNFEYGLIPFYRKYTASGVVALRYGSYNGWYLIKGKAKKAEGEADYKGLAAQGNFDMNWTSADRKYGSRLEFKGTKLNERMFVCRNSKFNWWSDNTSKEKGKRVSALGMNTCTEKPVDGWVSGFDTSHIQDYDSKYAISERMEVDGENRMRFGVYSKNQLDKNTEPGIITVNYVHKPVSDPIEKPVKNIAAVWDDGKNLAIGCTFSTQSDISLPDPCLVIKPTQVIFSVPGDYNSPPIGKAVKVSPVQSVLSNYSDSIAVLATNAMDKNDSSETFYPSGVSRKTLNDATDINQVFKTNKGMTSPLATTIAMDDSDAFELIKTYMKTEQGGKNSNFIGTPNKNVTISKLSEVGPNYFSLPENSNEAEEAIASMSSEMSKSFDILAFEQNSVILLNTQFSSIEQIPSLENVSEVEIIEQKMYTKFIEGNSTMEAKALIEKRNAERYSLSEMMSRGSRLVVPTQQRLPSLSPAKRLHYIAVAQKQSLKDGYIASLFSRIGKFKAETFELTLEASRINAKPAYPKIMADSLADAVKWSRDRIR